LCYVACVTDGDVARRYELVRSHLDEKARRLMLGAEVVALGRGGTKRVAEATGAHPETVARGRREVQSAEPQDGRIRRRGDAGRWPRPIRVCLRACREGCCHWTPFGTAWYRLLGVMPGRGR
jgi:hypothetical protein